MVKAEFCHIHSGPEIAWGVLGLIGSLPLLKHLGGVLVGSHVCLFRHGVRHLRLAMQFQSVRKLAVISHP